MFYMNSQKELYSFRFLAALFQLSFTHCSESEPIFTGDNVLPWDIQWEHSWPSKPKFGVSGTSWGLTRPKYTSDTSFRSIHDFCWRGKYPEADDIFVSLGERVWTIALQIHMHLMSCILREKYFIYLFWVDVRNGNNVANFYFKIYTGETFHLIPYWRADNITYEGRF